MKTKLLAAVVACAMGAGVLGLTLTAQDAKAPSGGGPLKVGIVNLDRVLKQYEKHQASLKDLAEQAQKAKENVDKKQQALRELEQKARLYNPGTEPRRTAVREFIALRHQTEALAQQTNADMDYLQAMLLRESYLKICEAVAQIAKEQGLSLVFRHVNGEVDGVDVNTVRRQIIERRIVFSAPELDLTDLVAKRLNAADKEKK